MGSSKTITNITMLALCCVRNYANRRVAGQLSCPNTEIKKKYFIAVKSKFQHKHLDDHKVSMKMGASKVVKGFVL